MVGHPTVMRSGYALLSRKLIAPTSVPFQSKFEEMAGRPWISKDLSDYSQFLDFHNFNPAFLARFE